MCVCSVCRIKPKACVQNKQNECSNVAGRPQAVTGVSLCYIRHAHMHTYTHMYINMCVCASVFLWQNFPQTDRHRETQRRTRVLHLYIVHACPTAETASEQAQVESISLIDTLYKESYRRSSLLRCVCLKMAAEKLQPIIDTYRLRPINLAWSVSEHNTIWSTATTWDPFLLIFSGYNNNNNKALTQKLPKVEKQNVMERQRAGRTVEEGCVCVCV